MVTEADFCNEIIRKSNELISIWLKGFMSVSIFWLAQDCLNMMKYAGMILVNFVFSVYIYE